MSTIRQFLGAGLIDELQLALRPVLLGTGEHLLMGLDLRSLGYECTRALTGERATHIYFRRKRPETGGSR